MIVLRLHARLIFQIGISSFSGERTQVNKAGFEPFASDFYRIPFAGIAWCRRG
jgi:hypothetical protein